MYTLLRSYTVADLLRQQAPALTTAFVIASVFYKFGSFALECVAFLATWYVFDAALAWARAPRRSR